MPDNTIYAVDFASGASHAFKGLDDPAVCKACSILLVRNGWITDVQKSEDVLQQVAISGGTIFQLNQSGKQTALSIANSHKVGDGKLTRLVPPNAVTEGRRIRGLILEGNHLRFVIASRGELPFGPQRGPLLFLSSASQSGRASVVVGEKLRVIGTNFLPTGRAANPVQISLDGKVVAGRVPVKSDGSFSIDLSLQHLPGEVVAMAEQQDGHRVTISRSIIEVISGDASR